MKTRSFCGISLLLGMVCFVGQVSGADFQFRHHILDRTLPVTDKLVGDYGLTALVDLDRDGDLDFVLGGRPFNPSQLYWYEFQAPDRWVRHLVGTNYLSDVGLAALDVDRDGWPDLVCSGVWYRNPGKPREISFERILFDETGAGAHDVLIADIHRNAVDVEDSRSRGNELSDARHEIVLPRQNIAHFKCGTESVGRRRQDGAAG